MLVTIVTGWIQQKLCRIRVAERLVSSMQFNRMEPAWQNGNGENDDNDPIPFCKNKNNKADHHEEQDAIKQQHQLYRQWLKLNKVSRIPVAATVAATVAAVE